MNSARFALRAACLAAAVAACFGSSPRLASAEPATQLTTAPAAFADAPLPRDPANVYGQFDNGLHYVIRKNANPPGKVALYLAVKSGSLNETAEQNGLAHFLEHMAFKGSAHFAPTKLIPLLTHMGMQFGADTNAHTNQYETVFKLTMPDTKPKTLDTALTIFSDYASALDLAPVQIDSERRVILEEYRMRKGVDMRLRQQENDQLFPGSQYALHDVLGNPEIIKTAPQALFADYWNKWYRPENMTLVVVGDIDPDALIAQARPLLGTFKARVPAVAPTPAGLKQWTAEKAIVLHDPEQVAGSVELCTIFPPRPILTTTVQYRQELIENVCQFIVNRRFADLVNTGKAPFRQAEVGTGDLRHEAFLSDADADGEPQDWSKMLTSLITGVHGAIDRGFTTRELQLAKTDMLSSAERAVQTESTRDDGTLVASMTSEIDLDRPLTSAGQDLDLVKKIFATLTLDDLQRSFNADFKSDRYAYVVTLPAAKPGQTSPTQQQVLDIAHAAWQQPTAELAQAGNETKLLAAEPAPGVIASHETDSQLQLTTVHFANGVVMHHKFSDYKKDQVFVRITLPGGQLQETADNHGISAAASLMLAHPATHRASYLQIRDLLTGKNVSVEGEIGLDSLAISVAGSPADLPTGMELVNAVLTDGKLEPVALDEWKKRELQAIRGRPMNPSAQLAEAISKTFYGGDPRVMPLTTEDVNRQQTEAAEQWFKHIADHSAIEVAVTGDISEEAATALVAKYLGSLPKRQGTFAELDSLRTLSRKPGPYVQAVQYSNVEPKAVVMVGYQSCDMLDPERRPLALVGLILTERLVKQDRFEQQLVYGIGARNTPASAIPGTGTLSAATTTDPKHVEVLVNNVRASFDVFAKSGPTDDELASAKKQMANQLTSQLKDPTFWLVQVAEMEYHHRTLADLKQLPGIFQTFTTTQLRDVAAKYITPDHLIQMEVTPAPTKAM